MALFQDDDINASAATAVDCQNTDSTTPGRLLHYMTAGTAESTTFRLRAGAAISDNVGFNAAQGGTRVYGGVCESYMIVWEIQG